MARHARASTHRDRDPQASHLPTVLTTSAAWSWRLLVIGGAVYVLLRLLADLTLVVLPVFLSLLLAALLHRPVLRLRRFLPRSLAALVVLVVTGAVLAAVGWFLVARINGQYDLLLDQVDRSLREVRGWLAGLGGVGPDSAGVLDQARTWLQAHRSQVLNSALTLGRIVVDLGTALILTVFLTLFFLLDGDRMWAWLIRLLPAPAQDPANGAGHRAFRSLSAWITGTAIIAGIHAVVVGLTLWVLGVPLVLVLAVLVFIGSFLPIIGAFLFGGLAVLVALATAGPGPAVVVLAVLLVENLLEGHVYQPLIMGRTVRLHPVVVLVALASGTVLAGVVGAIVAVPLAAAGHSAVKYLTGLEDIDGNELTDADRMRPRRPPQTAHGAVELGVTP